jgi:hypothetical protein
MKALGTASAAREIDQFNVVREALGESLAPSGVVGDGRIAGQDDADLLAVRRGRLTRCRCVSGRRTHRRQQGREDD